MRKFTDKIPYLILFFLVIFLSLTFFTNPLSNVIPANDSSIFIYIGYAMKHGEKMYLDLFDHKGPFIFFINFLGTLLPGKITGIYWIQLIFYSFFYLFVYKTARLFLPKYPALIPPIIFTITLTRYVYDSNYTEEYALPFIAYLVYVFSKYFLKEATITKRESFFVGLGLAVVFLIRLNMIMPWIVLSLALLFILIKQKKWKELNSILLFYSIGFFSCLLVTSLYFIVNKGFSEFIFQAFTFNFKYVTNDFQLSSISVLLKIFMETYIPLFSLLFLLLVLIHWFTDTAQKNYYYISIAFCFGLTFLASVVAGRSYTHYLLPLFAIATVPLSYVFAYLIEKTKNKFTFILLVSFVLLNYVFAIQGTLSQIKVANFLPGYSELKADSKMTHQQQESFYARDIAEKIKQDSLSSDKIYSHHVGGQIYLLSDRLAATKYFSLPAMANIDPNFVIVTEFLADMQKLNAEFIVVSNSFVANTQKNYVDSQLETLLNEHYTKTYSNNRFTLFKLNK